VVAELDSLTLARARRGERPALQALVETYQDRVVALVARILVRHPDAVPDVAQDVFLKTINALPGFEPSGPARLSSWILTIATRTCLDVLRRAPRLPEALSDEWPGADPDPESLTAQRRLAQRIERAMGQLPDHHRAALILRAYHDLDYDEIAATLQVDTGTVKSRLSRARQALREALAGGDCD
jgi:RNA polymerase sigma-70 factor (ECF subfamily)